MENSKEIKDLIMDNVNSLINWRALSIELTGNPNQITRTRIGKKYEVIINVLRDKITEWKLLNNNHMNIENKFNNIVKVGELGTLWNFTNGALTSNGDIFRLLSYDIFRDVYRLEFGVFGYDKQYLEVPGNQYPIYEYKEKGELKKTMCNPLKV
jgi:hypothetical protein